MTYDIYVKIQILMSEFRITSEGMQLATIFSSAVYTYNFEILYWSISILCYCILPPLYIYFITLVSIYCADSNYSVFIGYYSQRVTNQTLVWVGHWVRI